MEVVGDDTVVVVVDVSHPALVGAVEECGTLVNDSAVLGGFEGAVGPDAAGTLYETTADTLSSLCVADGCRGGLRGRGRGSRGRSRWWDENPVASRTPRGVVAHRGWW